LGIYDSTYPTAANSYWKLNVDTDGSVLDIYNVGIAEHSCFPSSKTGSQETSLVVSIETCSQDTSSASFSVMASYLTNEGDHSLPILIKGVPMSGSVAFHKMQYYLLQYDSSDIYDDILVRFSVSVGSVSAYVGLNWLSRPLYDEKSGAVRSYVFSTLTSTSLGGNSESIVLSHKKLQDNCISTVAGSTCYVVLGVC
jgi:hypothetical protein